MNGPKIIALQKPDGLWGDFFHTLAVPTGRHPLTTEQALRRLRVLGYTAEHPAIARALDTLRGALRGEFVMPDHREVTHDWDLFTRLMTAAWLRLFLPDDPDACAFADRWARVIEAAFAGGAYGHAAYLAAYTEVFGKPARGTRFIDLMSFYIIALLPGRLTPATEDAMLAHLLRASGGIYYIADGPLDTPPPIFASRAASLYLAAMKLLGAYTGDAARAQRRKTVHWLRANRGPDGWDFGPKAKDGVYLPRADSWRTRALRVADCTARVEAYMAECEQILKTPKRAFDSIDKESQK